MRKTLLAAVIALTVSVGSLAAAPTAEKEPLDAQTLNTIKSEFGKLMELANRHDQGSARDVLAIPLGPPCRQKGSVHETEPLTEYFPFRVVSQLRQSV
jgi:hypothetical protein